jgi:hypothetical protein
VSRCRDEILAVISELQRFSVVSSLTPKAHAASSRGYPGSVAWG